MNRRLVFVAAVLVLALLAYALLLVLDNAASADVKTFQPVALRVVPVEVSRSFPRPSLTPTTPSPSASPHPSAGGTQTSPSASTGARPSLPPADGPQIQRSVAPAAQPDGVGKHPTAAQQALRARIAWCESRNDPKAVNKATRASGLYQFMPRTWRAITGLEPPASAYPAAVQTAAFDALYAQRGTQPWNSSRSCWQ